MRGYELLDAAAARAVNPALRGEFAGALRCRRDAIVEPRLVPAGPARAPAGRQRPARPGTSWRPGREAIEMAPHAVRDHTGEWHRGDLVVVCTGASLHRRRRPAPGGLRAAAGPPGPAADAADRRRSRGRLTTSVADGDSLRYYPAFDLPGRHRLPPQAPAAAAARAQLLLVQRLDGSLTIGDTHEYDEPFAFDVDEDAYDHLRGRAEPLLGTALPPHPAPLGRRVQPGHRHRALPQIPDRPGRGPGHRPGRPGHDLRARYRRGDVRLTPTRARVPHRSPSPAWTWRAPRSPTTAA